MGIMLVVVYIFSIIGMELIVNGSAEPDYVEAAARFDSVGDAMMTLMQFMSLDSISAIYRPLITEKFPLSLYFLVFFLLGPVAIWNIVTAIMVESSIRTANEDIEAKRTWEIMKRQSMMPKLRSLFMALDTDGNRELDLQEFLAAPDELQEQ